MSRVSHHSSLVKCLFSKSSLTIRREGNEQQKVILQICCIIDTLPWWGYVNPGNWIAFSVILHWWKAILHRHLYSRNVDKMLTVECWQPSASLCCWSLILTFCLLSAFALRMGHPRLSPLALPTSQSWCYSLDLASLSICGHSASPG